MAPRRYFRNTHHAQRSANTTQPFFQPTASEAEHAGGQNSFFTPAPVTVQAQLTVGQPGDRYEQEADAMADRVVGMQPSSVPLAPPANAVAGQGQGSVQRSPQKEEEKVQRAEMKEEEKVQRVEMKEEEKVQRAEKREEEKIQRAPGGPVATGSFSAPASVAQTIRSGGGQPMDTGTRHFMESRFGQDFSEVRIYTGAQAVESAQEIQARAYTSGNQIVFGQGEYQPQSDGGKRLLAHELTHVVQQGNNTQRTQNLSAQVEKGKKTPRTNIKIHGEAGANLVQAQFEKLGSIGCPVSEIQEKLNLNGESLTVDGRFGALTRAAVVRFQTSHRLTPDGIVGPLTRARLFAIVPGNNHGLPTSEFTKSNGWAASVHKWRQRLMPFTTSFKGCRVTEADTGGGIDTCHFPGSAFAPFTAITGGTWDVDANNNWGDDFVGWFSNAVNFYRTNLRAPCHASFPQSMRIVKPTGDVQYKHHQLTMEIGTNTVSSTRDGHTQTRVFP